ncbi:ATP-binding protein [Spirulina sp. CS-785/01]|uniref:ATP-binding response regulator n=1 Tax=Spirulina sp. CS-785/01 TaxID=3021716 RepID=UPI00232D6657|nr:ATP-binding protein [Spirulina sp. CS-785/01]MDB9313567.1 ATP-binding protein [Spirulina sp. CS-785/01]
MALRDSLKILLIEDHLAEARLLREFLKESKLQDWQLIHVQRLQDAVEQLKLDSQKRINIILLDLTLPDSQGLDSLIPLLQLAPSVPIVVLTNTNDDELALTAVRQGAQDYLVKRHVTAEGLARSLCYAIERKQVMEMLREDNAALSMKVEERTQELVKAQEQNQLKTELVSMFSHDLRNPLNTILASAGLLEDSQIQLSADKKVRLFRQIRSASKSMAQLLDEVLLIGKADTHQLQCHCTLLNLQRLLLDLSEELQGQMDNPEQLDVTFEGVWKTAYWDEGLLRHAFINLLNNAVKYSPDGEVVEVWACSSLEQVTVTIQDHGIGIPLADQENLFQPFHRARNVGQITGTGLGLAIVKRCVEIHEGTIQVNSQEGKGTIFTVTLPVYLKTDTGDRQSKDLQAQHSHSDSL